jgi:hypothetical protein
MDKMATLLILIDLLVGTLGGIGGYFWWQDRDYHRLYMAAIYGFLRSIILFIMIGVVLVVLIYLRNPDPATFHTALPKLKLNLLYLIPAPFLGAALAYFGARYSLGSGK